MTSADLDPTPLPREHEHAEQSGLAPASVPGVTWSRSGEGVAPQKNTVVMPAKEGGQACRKNSRYPLNPQIHISEIANLGIQERQSRTETEHSVNSYKRCDTPALGWALHRCLLRQQTAHGAHGCALHLTSSVPEAGMWFFTVSDHFTWTLILVGTKKGCGVSLQGDVRFT